MYRMKRLVLGGAVVAALASALYDLRGALAYERARELASMTDARRALDLEFAERSDGEAVRAAETAARAGAAGGRAVRLHVRLLRKAAADARSEERAIEMLCRTLAAIGIGLERAPFDAGLLLNWANIRQMLGRVECGGKHTDGDYLAAARLAVETGRNDPDVAFRAALIALWGGNRERALELLRAVLENSLRTSDAQRRIILNEIRSADELRLVVPARFPQIVEWSGYFTRSREQDYAAWEPVFAELQRAALERSIAEFESGGVPMSIHLRRVENVLALELTDGVRSLVDAELARIYARRKFDALAKYFGNRSALAGLAVVRSALENDTRPMKQPFTAWEQRREISLDEPGTSVGFFLAPDQGVRLIELASRRVSPGMKPAALKLYASDDGERWDEFAGGAVDQFTVAGRTIVAVSIPASDRRYWKINYGASSGEGGFVNELRSMVRVYGSSAR